MAKADKHGDATSTITTRKDAEDGFTRTAIVVDGGENGGSIDLVTKSGRRLAQVNLAYLPNSDGEECLIVDVIDVDNQYPEKRAFTFGPGTRGPSAAVPEGGNLVSTDFRRPL